MLTPEKAKLKNAICECHKMDFPQKRLFLETLYSRSFADAIGRAYGCSEIGQNW
jgi:hypothetical protein